MAQLLVRNIPDSLVKALKIRAAQHGVSAEEEHRRILAAAMVEVEKSENTSKIRQLLDATVAEKVDDADDWMFDRNDPRNARPRKVLDLSMFDD